MDNEKNLKYFIQKYGMYVIEFCILYCLFIKAPIVGDRWNETNAQRGFESLFNYVFYMATWLQMYNARVLSLLFSFLVDYNITIRAAINAAFIVMMSLMLMKWTDNKEKRTKYLSILLPFIVSSGIYIEVYFYATTLYVSTAFIFYYIFYYFESKKYENANKVLNAIIMLIASTWLENLSLCIFVYVASVVARDYLKKRKVNWKLLMNLLICTSGLFIMFITNYNAKYSRTVGNEENKIPRFFSTISHFSQDNWLMICLLSLSVVLFLHGRKKDIFGKLTELYFGVFFVLHGIWGGSNIYRIVSGNIEQKDFYQDLYQWNAFSNDGIEKFFLLYIKSYYYVGCLLAVFAILLLFYTGIKYCDKKGQIVSILLSFCSSIAIHISGIYSGHRVYSLSIFILFWIICYFWGEKSSAKMSIWMVVIPVCIVLFDQTIFVDSQKQIHDERAVILNSVRLRQSQNEWDYDEIVILPAYKVDSEGKSMGYYSVDYEENKAIDVWAEISNPTFDNPRYDFMCHYYGISRNTLIEYK